LLLNSLHFALFIDSDERTNYLLTNLINNYFFNFLTFKICYSLENICQKIVFSFSFFYNFVFLLYHFVTLFEWVKLTNLPCIQKIPFLTVKIKILKIRVCFLVQQNMQIQGYVEKNDLCHDNF